MFLVRCVELEKGDLGGETAFVVALPLFSDHLEVAKGRLVDLASVRVALVAHSRGGGLCST